MSTALHLPMVGLVPPATEGNGRGKSPATGCNSTSAPLQLVAAVDEALARIGMSDKDAAAAMGITPGTWSRQKNGVDNCHIQLDKLALLPEAFHVEFSRIYGGLVGLAVAHETVADLLVMRVGQLLVEVNALAAQLRAQRRIA
jgi:transcriptional regulator with XRE-family HTH domain